ncbi:hypothetical protein [Plantactinospora sp. KBS50]|uniref:hypothetical protein n=1 Tax=Plantactinospora sp. KBS50 TaxID=2024580 RepID=UPI000BAB0E0C|nr:hypothetical protein [Plantactinospora sp. KBS50]ASW53417.1 hypothetical protein CIK06_03280 [Plantactinospora sp. KBS50]
MSARLTGTGTPTRPPCCWARALLAAPPESDAPPDRACAKPGCAAGGCKRSDDRPLPGLPGDPRWLGEIARRVPEPAVLTAAILRRLAEEGILDEDEGNG